jgi:hypothetical protein
MTSIDRNQLFFNTILDYQPFYDEIMHKSYEYDIQLTSDHFTNNLPRVNVVGLNKTKRCTFIPIGSKFPTPLGYQFEWYNDNVKDLIQEHVNRYCFIENNYVTRNSINYYFEDNVQLNIENRNIIPYLVSITNPNFNVIRFQLNNGIEYNFYCMINIGIKDNFDYQHDFLDRLIH